MTTRIIGTLLLAGLLTTGGWPETTRAQNSKRVYVFELDRKYWDVRPGDTLSGIAMDLLPVAPRARQQRLMDAIFELNRAAFINADPDRLRAYTRLWLPGSVQTHAVEPVEAGEVETYTWGTIKRIKSDTSSK